MKKHPPKTSSFAYMKDFFMLDICHENKASFYISWSEPYVSLTRDIKVKLDKMIMDGKTFIPNI